MHISLANHIKTRFSRRWRIIPLWKLDVPLRYIYICILCYLCIYVIFFLHVILNLALIDFIRCSTYTFSNGFALLSRSWHFGSFWCKLCGYISGWAIYSDILALNIIGISRCMNLKIKHKWLKLTKTGIASTVLISFSKGRSLKIW